MKSTPDLLSRAAMDLRISSLALTSSLSGLMRPARAQGLCLARSVRDFRAALGRPPRPSTSLTTAFK
jgi:hypothetical protein